MLVHQIVFMGKEKILVLSVFLALIKFEGLHGIRDKQ